MFSSSVKLIALGLAAHQVFRRYETYSIAAHASLLIIPPALVAFSATSSLSWLSEPHSLSYYYGTYLASLVLSVILYRLSPFHPLAGYPGPFWCRTTKFWNAFMTISGRQHKYYQALHERYGDIVRIGPNELTIRDSSMVGALMGTYGVPKGPNFIGAMLTLDVPMVGIQNTEEHLRRRRAWNRGLGPAALKEYEHLIAKRARQLVERLEEQGGEVVLGKWFNYFSYDLMSDMAFGGGSELIKEGDQSNVWRVIEEGVIPATFLGQVPWLGLYVGLIPAAVKPLNEFLLLGKRFATKRVERGSTTRDLFHYLNSEDQPDKPAPPMGQLVDDGILAIVAGSDTVSSALTSTFFCLLTHPEVYARLRDEVDKYYPQGEDPFDGKYYREMVYLQAVINEAIRLFPPIMTSSPRTVPHDSPGVHIASTYLPPGTTFIVPPYSSHRNLANFTLPDAFWPERWLIASGQMHLADVPFPHPVPALADASSCPPPPLDAHVFKATPAARGPFTHEDGAFLAFSHGPMNCVGKGLAMHEMRTIVCAVVQRFEMRLREGWDARSYSRGYKDYFVATRPEVPVLLKRRGTA